MRPFPLIALALAACGDMDFRYSGPATLPGPDTDEPDEPDEPDTDPPDTDAPDTDLPDTDVPDATACPDDWPDVGVAAGVCAVPAFAWDLVERNRSALPYTPARVAAGRFVDDDGDGDIDEDDRPGIAAGVWDHTSGPMYTYHGIVLDADLALTDSWDAASNFWIVAGNVDSSREGDELLFGEKVRYEGQLTWHGTAAYLSVSTSDFYPTHLTDLDGDGSPEVIVSDEIRDATDGTLLATLENDRNVLPIAVADIDLDGEEEILGTRWDVAGDGETGIWAADGTWKTALAISDPDMRWPGLAVADLDGDPEAEIVYASTTGLAILDTDGSLVASASALIDEYPYHVAVAQLDADADREIVVLASQGLLAFDRDLSLLWSFVGTTTNRFVPFVVADLDGDGAHEVVAHDGPTVRLLASDGTELASVSTLASLDPYASPMVLDLDLDGLSEIVVSGEGGVAVLSTTSGGFPVAGPRQTWSQSWGEFPGDRAADGSVPGTTHDPFWQHAATNVFHATALGSDTYADLTVESAEICDIDCAGTSTVAVYVGNRGSGALTGHATVQLWAGPDLLGEATLTPPLEAGASRAVTLAIPTYALDEELRATVSAPAFECEDGAANELSIVPVECE